MGPQPCLDVRHANPRGEARERRAQGARRVPLDHEQVRPIGEPREKRCRDRSDVAVRVLLAGTVQPFHAKCAEPETRGIEIRVLAGEDERGREPTLRQRMRDRRLLDGFRPGPDDQPDIVAIQPSP